MYFLALICPPLAILCCGKPFQAALNFFFAVGLTVVGAILMALGVLIIPILAIPAGILYSRCSSICRASSTRSWSLPTTRRSSGPSGTPGRKRPPSTIFMRRTNRRVDRARARARQTTGWTTSNENPAHAGDPSTRRRARPAERMARWAEAVPSSHPRPQGVALG